MYSVKPIDGSGDLTFSRGSDIEATRVAANGYIQKAQVNLLLQSNTFSTTWSAVNASVTGGQAGYDSTNDAWKLESTSAGVSASVRQFVAINGVSTYSVYAKAGNVNFITLYCASSGTPFYAWFNLNTGAVATTASDIDTSITSVGGGWYRVTLTGLNPNQRVDIYPANADGSYITAVGEYIYIQDAQLNYGLVAQDYVETTSAAVVSGITDNMPRLNYDPANPTCPSLLLEPSRQNILTNDTYYGGSDWNKIGVSPSANNAISPEGVANAVLLSETAINDQHSLYPTISVTSGNAYTASCFVKQGTGSAAPQYIGFRFRGGGFTDAGGLIVDLVNKVATYEAGSLTGYKIEDYGNGWLRVSITQSATVTSSSAGLVLFFNNNISGSYSTDYLGNVNADMLVYGMQIEQASYSSSLIPTYGSSATRTADACYKTGIASLIGQSEGTIFWEGNIKAVSELSRLIYISDGTISNFINTYIDATNKIAATVRVSASTITSFESTAQTAGTIKVAFAYKANDCALYVNGVSISGTSGATVPSTSRLDIGSRLGTDSFFNSGASQAILFKTRLPNSDLATLTSL